VRSANVLEGKVVRVADGDTITLLLEDRTQVNIRFSGIDAPEKGQAWGQRSRQSMSSLAAGRYARAYVGKRDRYGRGVAIVVIDGRDVGLEQLRRGMAWTYTRYLGELPYREQGLYLQAEREARDARRGLWSDPRPQEPWDWRRQKREGR
jgi:endonuclease YncB( thermonuclease family)